MKFTAGVFLLSLFMPFSLHADPLRDKIDEVEARLGVRVGVSILEPNGEARWGYRDHERFPLMSTFKTLACAKLLDDAEAGRVDLHHPVAVTEASLVTYSPVVEDYVGRSLTLEQACRATMLTSDNSAANIVLAHIDGPTGLTAFLRRSGDGQTRLDRIEPALNAAQPGDSRDTTTPAAINATLQTLLFSEYLSAPAREQLLQWMRANQVSGPLLRAALPAGWRIADRAGAGGHGSRGINAVVWTASGRVLLISIYLTGQASSMEERNRAIAELGEAIFARYR